MWKLLSAMICLMWAINVFAEGITLSCEQPTSPLKLLQIDVLKCTLTNNSNAVQHDFTYQIDDGSGVLSLLHQPADKQVGPKGKSIKVFLPVIAKKVADNVKVIITASHRAPSISGQAAFNVSVSPYCRPFTAYATKGEVANGVYLLDNTAGTTSMSVAVDLSKASGVTLEKTADEKPLTCQGDTEATQIPYCQDGDGSAITVPAGGQCLLNLQASPKEGSNVVAGHVDLTYAVGDAKTVPLDINTTFGYDYCQQRIDQAN